MDVEYYENLIRKYVVNRCLSTKIIGETEKNCTVSFMVKSGEFEIKDTFTVAKEEVEKWNNEQIYGELNTIRGKKKKPKRKRGLKKGEWKGDKK